MKQMTWLLLIALAAVLGYALWRAKRSWDERKRAEEERMASFIAQAKPAALTLAAAQALPGAQIQPAAHALLQASDANALPLQKLLFESAAKAAQAGEAALSIQLYARLLSRYPDSALAGPARAAVEEQKKKLARP